MAETGPPRPTAGSSIDVGSVLGDTYQITGLLGRGGMGSVFTASHMRLPGKRVAIKVIHTGNNLNDEVYLRFRREAEIATRIGHPNITEVLDWNTLPDGTPYLVLEYLSGETLTGRIARGPIPVDATVHIVRQIGSALAAAHRAGVVHRDLKPDNIFLVPTDSGGNVTDQVKILDFGISKIRNSLTLQTQEARVLGTPQYMAPEQASGKNAEIDQRTDVFALGAIVYEMLTGRPSFAGETLASVVYQVVFEQPPPLASLVQNLPPNVITAVERALQKEPAKRPPDVLQFVAELSGRPVDTLEQAQQRHLGPTAYAATTDAKIPPPSQALAKGSIGAQSSPALPTEAVNRPRKSRAGMWVALSALVVGGGAFAAWQSQRGAPATTSSTGTTVAMNTPPAAPPPPAPVAAQPAAAVVATAPPTTQPAVALNTPPTPTPAATPAPTPVEPPAKPAEIAANPVEPPAKPAEAPAKPPEAPAKPVAEAPAKPVVAAKPAAKPEPAKTVEPEEHEDPGNDIPELQEAEAAMGRHDYEEAVRHARNSLRTRQTTHAFGIMTRAYCGMKDLSNAMASKAHLPPGQARHVAHMCRTMGFAID